MASYSAVPRPKFTSASMKSKGFLPISGSTIDLGGGGPGQS